MATIRTWLHNEYVYMYFTYYLLSLEHFFLYDLPTLSFSAFIVCTSLLLKFGWHNANDSGMVQNHPLRISKG